VVELKKRLIPDEGQPFDFNTGANIGGRSGVIFGVAVGYGMDLLNRDKTKN